MPGLGADCAGAGAGGVAGAVQRDGGQLLGGLDELAVRALPAADLPVVAGVGGGGVVEDDGVGGAGGNGAADGGAGGVVHRAGGHRAVAVAGLDGSAVHVRGHRCWSGAGLPGGGFVGAGDEVAGGGVVGVRRGPRLAGGHGGVTGPAGGGVAVDELGCGDAAGGVVGGAGCQSRGVGDAVGAPQQVVQSGEGAAGGALAVVDGGDVAHGVVGEVLDFGARGDAGGVLRADDGLGQSVAGPVVAVAGDPQQGAAVLLFLAARLAGAAVAGDGTGQTGGVDAGQAAGPLWQTSPPMAMGLLAAALVGSVVQLLVPVPLSP